MRLLTAPLLAVTFGLSLAAATPSFSQTYPSQPIRIIVPTPPGGVADIVARTFGNHLTQTGKTVVVENKTGAGGALAADFAAKSPPDGYTVYVGLHNTQAILLHLTKLTYDPAKDFQAVTLVARSSNILITHPSVEPKTLKDVIAYAKANPGKLTYASQGNGSSGHIVGEQFKDVAGVNITHVPYRGAAPAMQDLVAGHVAMSFEILTLAVPQIKENKVRPIAVAAPARVAAVPDVPTFKELGMPELEGGPWFGILVPAGTPRPIVDWLHAEAKKAFSTPEVQARFKTQNLDMPLNTPEEFTTFIANESKRWGDVIRKANIKLD
jgi:tripartite-type tricarboxylate transporter receptor subunit TctC